MTGITYLGDMSKINKERNRQANTNRKAQNNPKIYDLVFITK
jgi:hypothetical protein